VSGTHHSVNEYEAVRVVVNNLLKNKSFSLSNGLEILDQTSVTGRYLYLFTILEKFCGNDFFLYSSNFSQLVHLSH
jgi:hypothetical protein